MKLIYPKRFNIPKNLEINFKYWKKLIEDFEHIDNNGKNIYGLLLVACKFTGTATFVGRKETWKNGKLIDYKILT